MKLRNLLKNKDKTKKILEEAVEALEENGEQSAVQIIMGYLNKNPESANEVMKLLIENKDISDEVVKKTATDISKSEVIPDQVIPSAVKESNVEVPDTIIAGIIEEGDVNTPETIQLINNLDDTKIKQEKVAEQLKELYENCEYEPELTLIDKLEALNIVEKNETIDLLERKIIARKMAINYQKVGGTKIATLARYMPVEEMMKFDLPEIVSKEYDKIKEKGEENIVNKSELRIQILDKIANGVVANYKEIGAFVVPQSESMTQLSQVEEKRFIHSIETCLRKNLDKKQITNIKSQIRGRVNNIELREYVEKIRRFPKEKIRSFTNYTSKLIDDQESFKVYTELVESGIMDSLKSISVDKREQYINVINEAISKRSKEEAEKGNGER